MKLALLLYQLEKAPAIFNEFTEIIKKILFI